MNLRMSNHSGFYGGIMCEEVKKMLSGLDTNDLMTKLALQCSPVIAGVKMSNLIIVKAQMFDRVTKIFADTELKLFVFCKFNGNTYALLYREAELKDWLNQKNVQELLEKYGYLDNDLQDILKSVGRRYLSYCENEIDFPHELGLILGFPPEDVAGFIENDGRNFLLSGYWKVYGDIERARSLFASFDNAKERAIRLIFGKRNLLDLLNSGSDIKTVKMSKIHIVQ